MDGFSRRVEGGWRSPFALKRLTGVLQAPLLTNGAFYYMNGCLRDGSVIQQLCLLLPVCVWDLGDRVINQQKGQDRNPGPV